jgi:hypothetical protein
MSQPAQPPPRKRWTSGAVALFALGLLILVPSGLCTAAVGIWMLWSEGYFVIPGMVLVGGPLILLGALLLTLGLRMRRYD